MLAGGVCHTLADVANPAANGKFLMAIYDHKVNNYECCPVFTFPTGESWSRAAHSQQAGRVDIEMSQWQFWILESRRINCY
jgi:hypothetical protein